MFRFLYKYLLIFAAMAVGLSSCRDDFYDNGLKDALKVSQPTVTVGNRNVVPVEISITSKNDPWTISGVADWFEVSAISGEKGITMVKVSFDDNVAAEEGGTVEIREAELTVTAGGLERTIKIKQLDEAIGSPWLHEDYDLNEYLYNNYIKPWYYNSELWENDPDFSNSYKDFFERFLKSLTTNEPDGKKWAKLPEYIKNKPGGSQTYMYRYLYSDIERVPKGANLAPLNYGMDFELVDGKSYGASGPVGRILYVMPNSPASRAGLRRGDWFQSVNDTRMGNWETDDNWMQYEKVIDSLVHPVEGHSPKLGMLSYRWFNYTLFDESRSVTVTPDRSRYNPILYSNSRNTGNWGVPNEKIIAFGEAGPLQKRVGYMVYTDFDPDYKTELEAEFNRFRTHNLTHFILDLRYSRHGTVEMAETMGNLLVPSEAAGKVFASYKFNTGSASANNRTVNFAPDPNNSIGVDTIFILTSKHTAGPAELLINALRGLGDTNTADQTDDGIIKLMVVGDNTEGMSLGMVRQEYSPDAGDWKYVMHIAAFRSANAIAGESDYKGGFAPNGFKVNEWENANLRWSDTWGWKGGEQTAEDRMLFEALRYVRGLVDYPSGGVSVNSQNAARSGLFREHAIPPTMTMDDKNLKEPATEVEE